MTEQEIEKDDGIFFSLEIKDSKYEILNSLNGTPPIGRISDITSQETDEVDIQTWLQSFVREFGYTEELSPEEILILFTKETGSITFTGPFGKLEIFKDCNITFDRYPT
ncbi:MAG: hypothetical protein UR61_C0026G0004 [candidate division WS6 bacterium GW2011_GWE1_34_7]|uniref:Uncharacterized protein n=1 Tax=candidate division WS6 bacterium GW2011_GWE1_34_7 TaxID=1619093 RepID=A0A0G0BNU9_9BACT|nr:MAG: hypothetical protein UR61_C0026G0004 [candidate division WS6 bacterium GW2011_GWE1_34_7]